MCNIFRPLIKINLKYMKHITAATILFAYLSSAFALGRVVSYDEFASAHFASIEHSESCGEWGSGMEGGQFRFFTAYLYGENMLFVDMVRPNENGSLMVVEAGFTIPELNNDHAEASISRVRCTALANGKIKLLGDARNGHDDSRFQFCVLVDGISKTIQYTESTRPNKSDKSMAKHCAFGSRRR
jgi:hypothetical protein